MSVGVGVGGTGRAPAAWAGPLAAGVAALAACVAAVLALDAGPGGGRGGDVAAASWRFVPSHAPGHPVHLVLARAACLVPVGSVAFRVRLLSAVLLGVAAALVCAAAARLARAIAGTDRRWPCAAVGCVAGSAGALSGPAIATLASADVYALQAALGALVVWACVDATLAVAPAGGASDAGESPPVERATGRLVAAALATGLAVVDHAPSGLPLVPPLVLAAALVLARAPRPPAVAAESPLAARLSWVVAAFAAGLVAVLALPLRAESLSRAGVLLSHVLSRAPLAAADVDAPPAAWHPIGGVSSALLHGADLAVLLAAAASLAAMLAWRSTRSPALVLLGFAAAPAFVRAGIGIDRAPDDFAAYLALPALVFPVALAAPAGLVLRLAGRGDGWRRRLVWGTVLALVGAALLRAEARHLAPARGGTAARSLAVAADALAEPPPPGAVRVVARPATAALVRYDDEVLGRRPDVATLHVPRLPEPGYAEEAIAERRDLAPLVSAYLGPVEPGPGLAEAIERLASRRDVFVEPGRLARVMAARSQLPRGTLIQLLPQPLARTDLGLALLGVERAPADVAGRLTGLEGSAAGAALAWNLAQASLSAVRIAASITPQRDAADDPRRAVLLEAARLADASATLGAPPDAVRRLRAAIEGRAGNEDEVLRLLDR